MKRTKTGNIFDEREAMWQFINCAVLPANGLSGVTVSGLVKTMQ